MGGTLKVGIVAPLSDLGSGYSVVRCVVEQAKMLRDAGHAVTCVVNRHFNERDRDRWPDGIAVDYCLRHAPLHDYAPDEDPRPDFESQCRLIETGRSATEKTPPAGCKGLVDAVAPFDAVLTHDMLFLGWYLPHNVALRAAMKAYPTKRWLHWAHSAPSPRPEKVVYPSTLRYTAADVGTHVFLNHAEAAAYAHSLSRGDYHSGDLVQPHDLAVVYNPIDIYEVRGTTPDARDFAQKYRMPEAEYVATYPLSSPRWTSKGLRSVFRIFGELKRLGRSVFLAVVNSHCNQAKDRAYEDSMVYAAEDVGLVYGEDFALTSRYARDALAEAGEQNRPPPAIAEWAYNVPSADVHALQRLSNLAVLASPRECCSLIQAEAALAGSFIVVNRECTPAVEHAAPGALSFPLTSGGGDVFWHCVAREIDAAMLRSPQTISERQARLHTYNPRWIYDQQLSPVLFAPVDATKGEVSHETELDPAAAGAPRARGAGPERAGARRQQRGIVGSEGDGPRLRIIECGPDGSLPAEDGDAVDDRTDRSGT